MAANQKKVTILGATGPTGVEVVKQALQRGYHVVAVVRSPEKLAHIQSDQLEVVKGDVFSTEELVAAFKGSEAVLSALGFKGSGKNTFYEDTNRHIVEALRLSGVTRFIAVSGWYTTPSSHEPFIVKYMVKPLIIGHLLSSMAGMEHDLVASCTDIDYTVVRAPRLLDGPATQKSFVTQEDEVCVPSMTGRAEVSRGDLARFMLDILADRKFIKKMVAMVAK